MRVPVVAAVVAVVSVSSAAPAVAAPAASPAPNGAGSATGLSAQDRDFLTAAGHGAAFEVAGGRLAADRAADPRIRVFGNRMVRDHGKELQQLQALDRTLGVTAPSAPGPDQQAVTAIWSSLRGGPFDCSYAPTMQADHEADLAAYTIAAQHTTNAQVRAFAKAQIPMLHQHLQLATRNLTGLHCAAPPRAPGASS
ncbi:DUF4142 domain-containing protein [Planosporangium thailandense]|uniref:DUF4142 domain-containing protein n=1 Tax=Planosporangium thailandense TaxID=765197 RepID=A0ABX0Y978_9ACTN|nr:DUF4142 domain-containing protein [Planosporangium thailandense]NJC73819.1 DUF4142 domain-containing protein [Planosporangium thailandense]